MDDLPYKIQIKFGKNSDGLRKSWLDENLKGKWITGKDETCYELLFEFEEDAVLTWWKWA